MQQSSLTLHGSSAATQHAEANYAEVALPVHVFQTFTYRLPDGLKNLAQPGMRVIVPLGRRLITGYIVQLRASLPAGTTITSAELKEVRELSDAAPLITAEMLQVTQWVSEYYGAPWGEVIKAALPPTGGRARQQRKVHLANQHFGDSARLNEAQRRVVDTLRNELELSLPSLMAIAKVSISPINSLRKRGLIDFVDTSVRRDPLQGVPLPTVEEFPLTTSQEVALTAIQTGLHQAVYAPFLLHGITGSGKTEVYIRAFRTALELGRSAIMLVPEIALTPVFSRHLRARFGELVAIFHSSLARGERYDEWARVRNGEARLVIGTRSAIFAPVENLGLIVVDEEHESTYRQQDSPQYNGRDTAVVRAQRASAVVVLGSATPSLESFHNSRIGKYCYLPLPQRIGDRPLAEARLIDMRQVFDRYGKPKVFSDELIEAISQSHARGEQSIILLNRRGYSSFVLCRSCGETIQCKNCDVTLTYHRSERILLCHYCNHRQPAPNVCPTCAAKYIYYIGQGTEQIEELLKKQFPGLRIARIDRDTTARRRLFEKSLQDFGEHQLDTLVGTQMLAKGHDYPNVTLVGVVSVDAGLALADFRAAERTFQLITQVAGRAGRGERPGQVLIQTYHPDHYALKHACAQDYHGFYEQEIRHRETLSYPPFVSLASLLVHGPDLKRVRSEAARLRTELDQANKDRSCRILGPAPAPLSRLHGRYRIQFLLKSRNRRRLRAVIDAAVAAAIARGANPRAIKVDIDPVSVM